MDYCNQIPVALTAFIYFILCCPIVFIVVTIVACRKEQKEIDKLDDVFRYLYRTYGRGYAERTIITILISNKKDREKIVTRIRKSENFRRRIETKDMRGRRSAYDSIKEHQHG